MANITILSIDGGGIRGIIPSVVLREIEERTGKQTHELFQMIAGNSTGGIIACGLSVPKPQQTEIRAASEILDLYVDRGEEIFERGAWQRISSGGGLTDEKYSAAALEDILEEFFKERRLKESTVDLLVPAYDIERRKPTFFKSWRAAGEPLDIRDNVKFTAGSEDFRIRDIARATTAAPTYFEPALIESLDGTRFALIDGGVFANNPTICAVASAMRIYGLNRETDTVTLVSLGTGTSREPIRYDQAKDWGLIGWARPILDILFDGVAATVDYQAATIFQNDYFRFDVDLKEIRGAGEVPADAFDDASEENIEALVAAGEALVRDEAEKLDALVRRLEEPPEERDALIARAREGARGSIA